MRYIARNRLQFGYRELYEVFMSFKYSTKIDDQFRECMKSYLGCKDIRLLNMGRSALYISLKIIDIRPGDKVICPAFSCLVVPEMIIRSGAKPILVDVDPLTYDIDVDKVQEKLDRKTRAIIPIHLFGHPADMKPLMDLAEDRQIYLIEDCAQAMGATYNGIHVGSFGDISFFSLGHGKSISAMEGGLLSINNQDLLGKTDRICKSIRQISTNYAFYNLMKQIGYSILSNPNSYFLIQNLINNIAESRDNLFLNTMEILYSNRNMPNFENKVKVMNTITAAIGLAQFNQINYFNEQRINNATFLSDNISRSGIYLPHTRNGCKHTFLKYSIRMDEDALGLTRAELVNILRLNGIDAETPYSNINKYLSLYKAFSHDIEYPISEELAKSLISLPIHPCLHKVDLEKMANIFSKLEKFIGHS